MSRKKGSGLVTQLKENFDLADYKAYFLMYKYVPNLLGLGDGHNKEKTEINSFEALKGYYKSFKPYMTEEILESLFITDENFKKAEKWLIEKLHQKNLIDLYKIFLQKSVEGDVQSFKQFYTFSEKFLKNDLESEESLFLQGVKHPDMEDNIED